MKWIPGRVKDSDYYVNYDYEMWGKVSRAEQGGVEGSFCAFVLAERLQKNSLGFVLVC